MGHPGVHVPGLDRCSTQSGSGGLVGRFLTLRVVPPQDYPKVPPTVKFVSKVNLPGVIDSSGNVSLVLTDWPAGWRLPMWIGNLTRPAATLRLAGAPYEPGGGP